MKTLTTLTLSNGDKATVCYCGAFNVELLGSEIAIGAPTREIALLAARCLIGDLTVPLDERKLTSVGLVAVHPSLLNSAIAPHKS